MFEFHEDFSTVTEQGEKIWHTICAQCGITLDLWEPRAEFDYQPEKVAGGYALSRSRMVFCSSSCWADWKAELIRDLHPEKCRVHLCDDPPLDGGICLTHINKERTSRYLKSASPCVICNAPFVPNNGEGTCSDSCTQEARRELSHRRRAREVGAFVADVNRAEVFKRDDYICQLCHLPIDMSLMFPHRMSPSIDHVVPLAVGGTHEPDNVQASHFGCNAAKGARVPSASRSSE